MTGVALGLDASFDWILAFLMIATAWRALGARDGFQSVVLFITFGVMASIAWIRIGSPDLALAEAAIGTGVAGAIFVTSLAVLERSEQRDEERDAECEQGEGSDAGE